MVVTVNGEVRELAPGSTVRMLIEAVAPKGAACAAEVNRRLVPFREQPTRILSEGDVIEVVSLIGGG